MTKAKLGTVVSVISGRALLKERRFRWGEVVPQFSVGSRADWIVSAPGVGSVHLLLTFDGRQLHVASVDGAPPTYLAGKPLDFSWNALIVPSELRFGQAAMRVTCQDIGEGAAAQPGGFDAPTTASPGGTQLLSDYREVLARWQSQVQTQTWGDGSSSSAAADATVLDRSIRGHDSEQAWPQASALVTTTAEAQSPAPAEAPSVLSSHMAVPVGPGPAAPYPPLVDDAAHLMPVKPTLLHVSPAHSCPQDHNVSRLPPTQNLPLASPSLEVSEASVSTLDASDSLRNFVASIPPSPPDPLHEDSHAGPGEGPAPRRNAAAYADPASTVAARPSFVARQLACGPSGKKRSNKLLLVLMPVLVAGLIVLGFIWYINPLAHRQPQPSGASAKPSSSGSRAAPSVPALPKAVQKRLGGCA